jgi:hypothetical protein
MNVLLVIVLSIIALVYLGGPLLIFVTQKMKARPRFETLEPSQMPAPVAEYVYSTANALRQAGFVPEAYITLPDAVPNVRAYLIMLTNREAGDKAMVTVLLGHVEGQAEGLTNAYTEFSTRFASGRTVDTMNSRDLSAFPKLPHEYKTQLPHVLDPIQLYDIHCHVMAHHAGIAPNDRKIVYDEGQAIPYLTEVFARSYEEQTAAGILYRTSGGDDEVYRPTWRGAFGMTWGLLFPFLNLRRMQRAAHGNKILASFRADTPASAA